MDIWAAIIGGIIGLATGLIIPVVKWQIEKAKLVNNERKDLIKELRAALSSKDFTCDNFIHSVAYSRVREYLSKELINEIEINSKTITIIVNHKRYGPAYTLLKEINELEKKWRLI